MKTLNSKTVKYFVHAMLFNICCSNFVQESEYFELNFCLRNDFVLQQIALQQIEKKMHI